MPILLLCDFSFLHHYFLHHTYTNVLRRPQIIGKALDEEVHIYLTIVGAFNDGDGLRLRPNTRHERGRRE